ncbi:hypothetical protein MRX96_026279 [Rhipicephalus microplus]
MRRESVHATYYREQHYRRATTRRLRVHFLRQSHRLQISNVRGQQLRQASVISAKKPQDSELLEARPAIGLLSLMVRVALAAFIAHNMTIGRDEVTPTTHGYTGSESYPPLVVPGPHYATEKLSRFVIWVLGCSLNCKTCHPPETPTKVQEMALTRVTEMKPLKETTSKTSVDEMTSAMFIVETTSVSTEDIEQVTKSSTIE